MDSCAESIVSMAVRTLALMPVVPTIAVIRALRCVSTECQQWDDDYLFDDSGTRCRHQELRGESAGGAMRERRQVFS